MVETDETGYDLVVTDIMMPGISGMEVIRQLRENFNTSNIPIVALTALDSTTSKIEGLIAGVDAYLTKPFSTRLLLATLINLMNQRNRLRERFSSENAIHTVPLITTRQDREFIDRLDAIIDKEMSNSDFSADDFASQMNLGRTIFFRKVKGVTGYTPKEYLRIRRLKRAAILLQTTDMSVSAVAFEVGINDPLYFSRCFKQQFGSAPSDYVRKQPKDQ
jgi:YesN/AraC family two-component response regulator